MLPHRFRLHTLAAAMACLFCHAPVWADTLSTGEAAKLQDIEVKAKRLSTDQQGEARQFRDNVSNEYIGKEELERFKVNAAGDVLKGLNGVYNMNTRTASSAITPNIRGLSGKGRIPVTLDGTEQTVDVWMNNYGVSDRNYLDPALFRSIVVEKSPALTRGVKSGVGGAVAIRTIEPEDLIPEGKKWGMHIQGEFSNNSVEPQTDLNQYLGWEDYRTMGNATADNNGNEDPGKFYENFFRHIYRHDQTLPRRHSSDDNRRFNGDKSLRIGAAFKTDITDGLAAYAYRNKGNYFAGRRGESGYLNNPNPHLYDCYMHGSAQDKDCKPAEAFIPNMAKVYPAGSEILNSNSESKTLLLKNNWYLPNKHKLGWQYMRTDVRFGEINPAVSQMVLTDTDWYNDYFRRKPEQLQVQNVDSKIRTDTYKLAWEWKPEGSRWIDLDANLWRIKTNSTRFQSGGYGLVARERDMRHDWWYWCTQRGQMPPYMLEDDMYNPEGHTTCKAFVESPMMEMYYPDLDLPNLLNKTREQIIAENPNTDGKYNVFSGAEQKTQVTRTGFDISNRFRLTPSLSMTWSADYQREKLDESSSVSMDGHFLDYTRMMSTMTRAAGPRGGKRREWGSNLVFDWQATDRLKISAGVRYHNFKALDTALAAGRARRDPRYAAGGHYIDMKGNISFPGDYRAGFYLPYFELVSKEEADSWKQVQATRITASKRQDAGHDISAEWAEYLRMYDAHAQKYQMPRYPGNYGHGSYRGDIYHILDTKAKIPINGTTGYTDLSHAVYRTRPVFIPYQNGKLDSSAFDRAYDSVKFGEQVADAQGTGRTYQRYLGRIPYATDDQCANPSCTDDAYVFSRGTLYDHDIGGDKSGELLRQYTEAQRWAQPKAIKGHAWSPTVAVTYDLTDQHRLFARYAQATRFPSIYESSSLYNDFAHFTRPFAPNFHLKPEKSRSWELGWNYNFAPHWSKLRQGDIRLTYYRNRIKNIIETTDVFRITQYDRKDTSGLELQARWDSGRFFGALGANYRLKQQMCDRDTQFRYDPYGNRGVPLCVDGGYGATRGYRALQPKYSLNLDMGTRLLGEKLELGVRGIYHSGVDNKQYKDLANKNLAVMMESTGKPYHWRPTLVWDMYGRYQINKHIGLNVGVTNVTNRYYLDPMSNVPVPGPGRTVTLGIQGKF